MFLPFHFSFHWYLAIIVNPARILRPPPPKRPKVVPVKRATRSSQENVDTAHSKPVTTSRFFSAGASSSSSQPNVEETKEKKEDQSEKTVIMDSDGVEELSEPELPASDKSRWNSPAKMDLDDGPTLDQSSKASENASLLDTDASTKILKRDDAEKAASRLLHDQVQGLSIATAEHDASDQTNDERFVKSASQLPCEH